MKRTLEEHAEQLAALGHPVVGIDRSEPAIASAAQHGRGVLADIENGPWPLCLESGQIETFAAVVVTNYLWRALFERIRDSLEPGGVLIYETFASGQQTVGRPSCPEFLLRPGELLRAFGDLRVVAFEDGFVDAPARFVQRIVAVKPSPDLESAGEPVRYLLA